MRVYYLVMILAQMQRNWGLFYSNISNAFLGNPLASICWDAAIISSKDGKFEVIYAWRVNDNLQALLATPTTAWNYFSSKSNISNNVI